jgi:hypothetical protein
VHHDTIELRRGPIWINVIYDEGEPVEVRFLRGDTPCCSPGLLDLIDKSVDAFLSQVNVCSDQEVGAQVEALLRDLPPALIGDSGFMETLQRLLG